MNAPFSKSLKPAFNYIKSVRNAKIKDLDSSVVESADATQALHSKKEQNVLKVSMISALVLAIFGIGFGIGVKSLAIIFDGFVALVSVGLGALSVITSRYIYKEDDDIFQYGYVRFEPMVNLFKALVLVIVCVYAFISAFSSVLSGGYEVHLGGAVIYSVCAFIFCLIIFIYTRCASLSLESDLIKVDNIEWKIDCVMYFGALVAFGVVWVLLSGIHIKGLDSSTLARYIDPILLCILSLMLCISPLKIAIANFKDLLMVAPKELDSKITHIMEVISHKYGFSDYDSHTAKSGRFFMIEINILVSNECQSKVADLDIIRDEIESALALPSYKIWLSVNFTTNPKWL